MVDLMNIVEVVGPLGLGSAVGWFATTYLSARKQSAEVEQAGDKLEAELEEARQKLALNLVEQMSQIKDALKVELDAVKAENAHYRKMEKQLVHFDEALRHIEALVKAPDEEARKFSSMAAQAFLDRTSRL